MSCGERLLPEPPDEPLPGDCCGNGCSPCVLDVYQDLLQKWKDDCNRIEGSNPQTATLNKSTTVLSMTRYLPFQLTSIKKMTDNTNLYSFQSVVVSDNNEGSSFFKKGKKDVQVVEGIISCLPGQHLFLRGVDSNSQDGKVVTTRAYTPISDQKDHARGKFVVMIKLYEKGIMSGFIRQLELGDVTFWRGAYGSFLYKRNSFKSIFMLCAGTGVAPMYPVARQIVNDDQDDTIVRMVFFCKSIDDLLLRSEIHALRSYWNFSADMYLTSDSSGSPRYGETLIKGRLGKDDVQKEVNKLGSRSCLVLICGPPLFNESMEQNVRNCEVPKDHIHVF